MIRTRSELYYWSVFMSGYPWRTHRELAVVAADCSGICSLVFRMYIHIDDMLIHMRTTFILDDDLYMEVKKLAVEQRRTATSVVEEALLRFIEDRRRESASPLTFRTFSSELVNPQIDLMNNVAMQDYLDETEPGFEQRMVRDHVYA